MSLTTAEFLYTKFDDEAKSFGQSSAQSPKQLVSGMWQVIWQAYLDRFNRNLSLGNVIFLPRVQEFVVNSTRDISVKLPSSSVYGSNVLDGILMNLRNVTRDIEQGQIDTEEINPRAVHYATEFTQKFYCLLREFLLDWKTPHLSIVDGSISFEWWRNNKTLAFFIDLHGNVDFLKAWGPHMWNDMAEGSNPSSEELIELWKWLTE